MDISAATMPADNAAAEEMPDGLYEAVKADLRRALGFQACRCRMAAGTASGHEAHCPVEVALSVSRAAFEWTRAHGENRLRTKLEKIAATPAQPCACNGGTTSIPDLEHAWACPVGALLRLLRTE